MPRKVTSYRLPELTLNQIEHLTAVTGSSDANVIAFAIDRMYQKEVKTMTTFINIDERYGEQVPVTLDDYKALNPEGQFEQTENRIIETLPNPRIGPITIALSQKLYSDSKRT